MIDFSIPGYRLIRELGHGGMATVFLAIQESFGREVAVKIMSEQLSADPTFGERFLREARIVSSLVHPHIVTVYDVGTANGKHFLSMEYVPGEDLKATLNRLPLQQIVRVIKEVASALDYAGKKGYVHRDIKPENIMLKNDDGRAILMDFGIARACDTLNGMTQTGTAIGTPYYMSPEQAKGAEVDNRSDLYSLGVVLFQLLSGKVPYSGDSAISVGIKHISEPIPQLPEYLAQIFQPIIDKLMAKSPDDRFQSGASLISALNNLDAELLNRISTVFNQQFESNSDETVFQPVISAQFWSQSSQFYLSQTGKLSDPMSRSSDNLKLHATSQTRNTNQSDETNKSRKKVILIGISAFAIALIGLIVGKLMFVTETPPPQIIVKETPKPTPEEIKALVEAEKREQQLAEVKLIVDQISKLEGQLLTDIKVHKELSDKYVSLEKVEASHPVVSEGRNKLKNALLAHLNSMIVAGDYNEAKVFLDEIVVQFPELTESQAAIKITKETSQNRDIDGWLIKAKKLLRSDRLTGSGSENAYSYYSKVLAVDPTNKDAIKGIEDIARRFSVLANKATLSGDFESAKSNIQKARDLNSGATSDIDKAQKELDVAIEKQIASRHPQQSKIDNLISRAQSLRNQGKNIFPVGDSALDIYRSVLELNPSDKKALSGIEDIEKFYRNEVMQRVIARNYSDAKLALNEVVSRIGATPGVRKIAAILNDELSQAGEERFVLEESGETYVRQTSSTSQSNTADSVPVKPSGEIAVPSTPRESPPGLINQLAPSTGPAITKLVIQSENFNSVDLPKFKTLSSGRVVYVGFKYANFESDTTLLTADLYDGGRTLKISTVPVVVKGESGQAFFKLARPVTGFSLGSYHLDISLSGAKIGSYQFMIEK